MNILIVKIRNAFNDQYDIYFNNKKKKCAKSQLLRILTHIDVYDIETNEITSIIDRKFTFIGNKFIINISGMGMAEFHRKSIWSATYQSNYFQDVYEIYVHRVNKYSVYMNGIQIAEWEHGVENTNMGNKYSYNVIANDNCNIDLITAFCLIIDNLLNNGSKEAIMMDIYGRTILEEKEYNSEWRPNINITNDITMNK